MQMDPQSLNERPPITWENIDFLFLCVCMCVCVLLVPKGCRHQKAFHCFWWLWAVVFSLPELADVADQGRCYPLSCRAAVQHDCFPQTENLLSAPLASCLSKPIRMCVCVYKPPLELSMSVSATTVFDLRRDFQEASPLECWGGFISSAFAQN